MRPAKDSNIFNLRNRDEVYKRIIELIEQKHMRYDEVAKHLGKEGWTGVNGRALTQPMISRFLIRAGYRKISPHGTRADQQSKVAPPKRSSGEGVDRRLELALQALDLEIDLKGKLALVEKILRQEK
jgi:transposase